MDHQTVARATHADSSAGYPNAGTARPAEWVVLVTAALGTMLAPLNSTMIVVALPDLLTEFGSTVTWGAWIVTSYLVAMAALQPVGGGLGDRYGRQRLFLIGLGLFLAATMVAAFSWNVEILLIARTFQAVGGAVAIPNGTALVRSLVPGERQGRAFGKIGAGIAVAAAAGPLIGGLVTDSLGWRWIFAANILLVVPALVLALRLPRDRPAPAGGSFDLQGAILLATTLVPLALALTVWRLPSVPIALAPALGLLTVLAGLLLLRHVRRFPRPVLNLSLFRERGFTPATATVLLSNLTMYTVLLSLPLFLNERGHWSSSEVGLLLAGLSIQTIIFSPLGGWLSDRSGRRVPAVAGTAVLAIGVLPFLAIGDSWTWMLYLAPLVLIGIGLGLSSASVQTTAVEVVPSNAVGQAAGLFSTMRYLGSIIGSSGMAAVLAGPNPPVGSFRLLYAALFLSACAAIIAASRLPRWSSAPHEPGEQALTPTHPAGR